jgi:hypothetical protein
MLKASNQPKFIGFIKGRELFLEEEHIAGIRGIVVWLKSSDEAKKWISDYRRIKNRFRRQPANSPRENSTRKSPLRMQGLINF